jgi:oxygen-independent coproporphyrinogen-3 oxidase
MENHSLYIHIPFCSQRCGYCDFNTYAGLEDLIPAYTSALCAEIDFIGAQQQEPILVHTIFFGGGTPSLMPVIGINQILAALRRRFAVSQDAEISLEANPGGLMQEYLEGLRAAGINRLSIGMQSVHPGELRMLERQHDYPDVIRAVTQARRAGFEDLNLDLIFGSPEQSLDSWQRSLELALGLHPEHFALYALTIEPETPFGAWARRGLLSVPNPDLAAEMYEWSRQRLKEESYTQYEISNWARDEEGGQSWGNPPPACRHNLQYWRNRPYLGIGAGAHGYAAGVRTANLRSPGAYIQRLTHPEVMEKLPFPVTPATEESVTIDREMEISETMMMGLRLTREGVSVSAFHKRFGEELEAVFGAQIERLSAYGLLEWFDEGESRLRLTKQGRLLGNQVFLEFL